MLADFLNGLMMKVGEKGRGFILRIRGYICFPRMFGPIAGRDCRGMCGAGEGLADAFVKRGINNPASLYAKVLTGTHSENLVLAAMRKADIATANNEELALLRAKQPELADQLKILWTSPFLPQSPLIWSTALPLELRKRIQQVAVSLGKNNAADRDMLKNVNNLSGFRKSKNSQLVVAGDIEMFAALQQVNNNAALPEAEKTRRREAISERASRLELRLKLPPSVQ